MKQLLLFTLFICSTFSLTAQTPLCVPDSLYRDSSAGVFPSPRNMENPDGGIDKPACINTDYEFVFTFKVPSTFEFGGATLGLDSIVVDTTASEMAVGGLPDGLNWGCNPPNCVFDPIMDSLGCLVIYGSSAPSNGVGDYPLTIATTVHTSFLPLELSFPNSTIPGADGDYTIELFAEGSPECNPTTSTQEIFESRFSIGVRPNPFSHFSTIEINALQSEELFFSVSDLLGKRIHAEVVNVVEGQNTLEFDGSKLTEGVYVYTLSSSYGVISNKLLIQR